MKLLTNKEQKSFENAKKKYIYLWRKNCERKTIEEQGEKQTKTIEEQKEKQIKQLKTESKNRSDQKSKYRTKVNRFFVFKRFFNWRIYIRIKQNCRIIK